MLKKDHSEDSDKNIKYESEIQQNINRFDYNEHYDLISSKLLHLYCVYSHDTESLTSFE